MALVITADQCVLDNETKFFICGICNNLVQKYLIHDGGYGQDYCQRPYCISCIDTIMRDSLKYAGKFSYAVAKCPVPGCSAAFKHPMFRSPTVCNNYFYSQISVKCPQCLVLFSSPEVYSRHAPVCKRNYPSWATEGGAVERHGNFCKQVSLSNLQRQSHKQFISFNGSLGNSKYIYGNLKKTPRGMVIKVFFENKLYRLQFDSGQESKKVLSKLKQYLGTQEDLKLLFIKHKSLRECGSLRNFMCDIPVGAPINLTAFRPNISDPNKYVCLYRL